MKEFSERLKELRLGKRLTQVELASATGLSQAAIALWENGQRVPNAQALWILADFFEVTVDFLLGRSEK